MSVKGHADMRIELGLCSSTAIATEDALKFGFKGIWKSLIALLLTMTTAGFTTLVLVSPHLHCRWRFWWKQLFISIFYSQDQPWSINRANLCKGHRGQDWRQERRGVSEFLLRLHTTDCSQHPVQNLEHSVCLPPGWLVSSKANCQASSALCILKSINAKCGVTFVWHKTLFFLVMNHWKHLSCRLWVFMLYIFWCRYSTKYT